MGENIKEYYYIGKTYNRRIDGIHDNRWKVLDVCDDSVDDVEFIVQSSAGVYKIVKKEDLLSNN